MAKFVEWEDLISKIIDDKLTGYEITITKKSIATLVKQGPRPLPDLDTVDVDRLTMALKAVIEESLLAKDSRRLGKPRTRFLHEQDVKVGLRKAPCQYLWFCG